MSPRNRLLELPDRGFKINVPAIFQKLGRKTQQSRKKKSQNKNNNYIGTWVIIDRKYG